jgi:two-component system sensor kinase FixL
MEITLEITGQTLVNFAGGLEAPNSCRPEILEDYASQTTGTIEARRIGLVTFAEEGCDIEKDDLEKIYRPFFTTKPEGQGIGLGFYVAGNIVMEHKEALTAAGRVWEGTLFHVALPAP